MKLLFCYECHDVFNLAATVKTCSCGKTRGQYTDNINAVYSGGTPLGFANSSFVRALMHQPDEGQGEVFAAFVIPENCPTFKEIAWTDSSIAESTKCSMQPCKRTSCKKKCRTTSKRKDTR